MTLRALWLAIGIILPVAAGACEANWRAAQFVLGAAGLELVDAEGDLAIAAGEACRVSSPSMRLRGETRMAARSLTWRTSQRGLAGSTLLLDVQVRGLTLDAGAGDDMARHLAEVMSLARPTDLMMTLTWTEETGRIELRTRSGSFRPSIWASAVLNDTGPPGDDTWWAGFETASLREMTARLHGEGIAERVALSLLALDRLRGEGDPAPRLAALQDVIGNEIAGLPGGPALRCVGLGRDAGHLLEQAVKIEPADTGMLGQGVEAWRFFRFLDHPAGSGHQFRAPAFGLFTAWFATLAGPETCFFRLLRRIEKGNVLAQCRFRRAGRTAIDARGAHGKEELSVCARVPFADSPPAVLIGYVLSGHLNDSDRHDILLICVPVSS